MSWGLLVIFPAVAGYWFIKKWLPFRYMESYWSGYHLLLSSVLSGGMLVFAAFILHDILHEMPFTHALLSEIEEYLQRLFFFVNDGVHGSGAQNYAGILAVLIISFLLAKLVPVVHGPWAELRQRGVNYYIMKAAEKRGGFRQRLLKYAMEKEAYVELILEDGTVYIGFVRESGITVAAENTDIVIMPVSIRSREPDSATVQTEYYTERVLKFMEKFKKNKTQIPEYLSVAIPLSKIQSVRILPEGTKF